MQNPNDSEDDSIHAGNNSPVQVTRVQVDVGTKTIILMICVAALLAVSIAVNYECLQRISTDEREHRLADYDLAELKAEYVAPIQAKQDQLSAQIGQLQERMNMRIELNRRK